MADLRQAARELARELRKFQHGEPSESLTALEQLEQALADDEPTTDELLRRLHHPPYLSCRLTYGTKWMCRIDGDGPPLFFDLSLDPITALRGALLQLPPPTEPPPED